MNAIASAATASTPLSSSCGAARILFTPDLQVPGNSHVETIQVDRDCFMATQSGELQLWTFSSLDVKSSLEFTA